MKILESLIGEFETALDKYQDQKYGQIELDDETSEAIFSECRLFLSSIKEKAEELDETIDDYIESMNEPSTYREDCKEDDARHYENMKGV